MEKAWMKPPFCVGEAKEVDATPEILTPLMVAGWTQCDPPRISAEVKHDVND